MQKILCLGCLILMAGLAFGQELDEKLPLLDEPIISPTAETSTIGTTTTVEIDTPTSTPEITSPPSQVGTPSTAETTTPPQPPPQEETVGTITVPSAEGTVTTSLDTEITLLPGTSTVGTATTEVGTPTPEITPPPSPPLQIGTSSTSEIATPPQQPPPMGTVTQSFIEGTTTTDPGTQTTPLPGTLTVGTVTVGTPTLSNTGLILIPTGYRRNSKSGFNTDFIIAYYTGELWHSMAGGEFFEPIKFLFLSTDFKYCLLKEKKKTPGLGVGYEWFLVIKGQAATTAQMGGQFSGKSDRFGYPYLMVSKKFKNTGYHLGMMSGDIGKLLNPLSEYMEVDGKKAIIFGLDTKLFNRQINIEGIMPTGGKSHLLINTSIERFLGFDLCFMKMPDGFSVIGYFGIRMTILPHIKGVK
ncbi:MAG: hypothetical protein QME42_09140 [bacterium]|nr:hypothetical protein [bacterium]